LVLSVDSLIAGFEMRPEPAELVRAPRSAFTTRPASILTFADRIVLEALTAPVEAHWSHACQTRSSGHAVVGTLDRRPTRISYRNGVRRTFMKADISHFYESVEHSLLGVLLSSQLNISSIVARAVERDPDQHLAMLYLACSIMCWRRLSSL
jgi:hypothetical protein